MHQFTYLYKCSRSGNWFGGAEVSFEERERESRTMKQTSPTSVTLPMVLKKMSVGVLMYFTFGIEKEEGGGISVSGWIIFWCRIAFSLLLLPINFFFFLLCASGSLWWGSLRSPAVWDSPSSLRWLPKDFKREKKVHRAATPVKGILSQAE